MHGLNCLSDVIMCAINSIEAGDSKKEAVQSIASFVEDHYMRKTKFADPGELPALEAKELNERCGMEYKVHDGKVLGIRFGGGHSDTDYALMG